MLAYQTSRKIGFTFTDNEMMLCLKVEILNVDSFDTKQKNCILISVDCKLKKRNDWNESEKGK